MPVRPIQAIYNAPKLHSDVVIGLITQKIGEIKDVPQVWMKAPMKGATIR